MSAAQDKPGFTIPEGAPAEAEREALSALRHQYHSALVTALVARGASPTEAEDLLADLWGDCVNRGDDQPSLLQKFSGKCPVQSWLLTVATHRLLDLKRRQRHRGELANDDRARADDFDRLPAAMGASVGAEGMLLDLLRESLRSAFARCSAETLLMLRLVYLNGLNQREIARMWGWHETKVSRALSQAMTQLETITLQEVRQRDPWLQIDWPDFLELCESHQLGFI